MYLPYILRVYFIIIGNLTKYSAVQIPLISIKNYQAQLKQKLFGHFRSV